VVPVGMGGEPGDHRNAESVHVIGELVQIGTVDAGIDQDQPTIPAHHDGIAPDPLALPDPDAVGHLIQHRFTLSGVSVRRELQRPSGPDSGPAGVPRNALYAADRSLRTVTASGSS
jgi:hypothetical protein